jgi:lipoprotein-anchoring transpeptidase ErfK/SrfK
MDRRSFISGMAAFAALPGTARAAARKATEKHVQTYFGAEWVDFETPERPGTVIVKTHERALYHVQGNASAIRYGVAVGKQGFDWAGVAQIGRKVEWPTWTPPKEMIKRRPELAQWANGMPGGIPQNPLGTRALYLFAHGRDTLFRIHGTNEPWSIGHAASSGCIRMLNEEVEFLYESVRVGTKVIVL